MKLDYAEQIVEYMETEGTKASLYEGYSGRGMYGRETSGVVAESVGDVTYAMGALGIKERIQTDSMGLDVIVY